jgi:Raf kinase inhibitor-like YbhB/YbcL family protein
VSGVLQVTSEQFEEAGEIPISAAHPFVGGANRSPQLSWSGLPTSAKSLAITCWDGDAPTSVGFCHWVRFGIPISYASLDEGAGTVAGDWTDGFTDWGERRYGGMAPPAGDAPHHYEFNVYALDYEPTDLDRNTTFARFRFAIRQHVVGLGTLTGTCLVEASSSGR